MELEPHLKEKEMEPEEQALWAQASEEMRAIPEDMAGVVRLGLLTASHLVKLRTNLHCRLSDKDLKTLRQELKIIGDSTCTSIFFAQWVNISHPVAKKIRARARGPRDEDPVETLRLDVEMEARLRAFRQPESWIHGISTKKTKARDLPGRRVRVTGYGDGTVIGYKSSRFGTGTHVIEFDIGGIQTFRLDYKSLDFMISSDIYVEEYVEHCVAEYDQQAAQVREQAEKRATKEAMQQSHAWLSGASISRMAEETPEELMGKVVEIAKGKRGQVTNFKKGKHTVNLDGGSSHNINLSKIRLKVLNDDFILTYSTPIINAEVKKWCDERLAEINAERDDIAAQEALDYAAKMELYEMQQAKQALADAAVSSDQLFLMQYNAYKRFADDFRPSAEGMDPELIDAAGGIEGVLKQTWIMMPRYERSIYENNARDERGPYKAKEPPWLKLPGFDEVEPPQEYMRVLRDTKIRAGFRMDTEEVGQLQAGEEVVVLRTKMLEPTKEEQKEGRKQTMRVKIKQGWVSATNQKGEAILEDLVKKEPSYVARELPLKYIDIVSCVRLTELERELIYRDLDPTWFDSTISICLFLPLLCFSLSLCARLRHTDVL
eukprot:COSAG05_NODE_366_length_10761_cov_3.491465_6_plen_604_part_00